MSNVLVLNKYLKPGKNKSPVHCRNNRIKLSKPLHCEKCKSQDLRLTKKFETVSSLYSHLICVHNGSDKYEIPTKEDCINQLQKISDSMNGCILKK